MSKRSLLVIADELVLLNTVGRIAENSFQTTLAPGGGEGLTKLAEQSFDLVVTDLRMPEVNGIQILQTAKLVSPRTQVIVLSGLGDADLVMRALTKGAFAFVTKPVQSDMLKSRLEQATAVIEGQEGREYTIDILRREMGMRAVLERDSERLANFAGAITQGLQQPLREIMESSAQVKECMGCISSEEGNVAATQVANLELRVEKLSFAIMQLETLTRARDHSQIGQMQLAEVAGRVAGILEPGYRRDGVELALNVPQELTILAHQGHLDQVLMNLVKNAHESITMGARGRSKNLPKRIQLEGLKEGRWAVLDVRDTGAGVPEELAGSLFDPFVTGRKGQGGTGLGLYITKTLLENFGAQINLQDTGPHGTTFRLRFPAA